MIKVLHLFGKLDRGGAELRTIETLKEYDEKRYEFVFLSLSGEKGLLDDEVINQGYKVYYIKMKTVTFPYNFLKLIKKEKINIVHSHIFYSSAIIVLLTKIFTKAKVISHFRTSGIKEKKLSRKIRNQIFKAIIKKHSDLILFVSNVTKYKIFNNSINDDKALVMYNGFNQKINRNMYRDKITHVGRFSEAKNQKFLLEVAASMKNYHFELVGKNDTAYGESFKNSLSKLNIENIKLVGITDEVDKYLQRTKLFLFPSTREGLPGALIEAALNNCYIIASDIDENKEVARIFPQQIRLLPLNSHLWVEEIKNIMDVKHVHKFDSHKEFSVAKNVSETMKAYEKIYY